jgi:hypothetical protein
MKSLTIALLISMMAATPSLAAKRAHPANHGTGTYPSVGELQNNLNLRPGTVLPRAIMHGGRIFEVFYVTAVARPNGEYVVTLRLGQ